MKLGSLTQTCIRAINERNAAEGRARGDGKEEGEETFPYLGCASLLPRLSPARVPCVLPRERLGTCQFLLFIIRLFTIYERYRSFDIHESERRKDNEFLYRFIAFLC